MLNLSIPQPNMTGLFTSPSGASGSANSAYSGYTRGRELAGNARKDVLRRKLGELVQRHDITTPQGKLALVKELSESGLGEEVMQLQKDFHSQAGQVLDTPQGYQIADPSYGRAHPMEESPTKDLSLRDLVRGNSGREGGALKDLVQGEPPTEIPGWAAPAPQPQGLPPVGKPPSKIPGGSRKLPSQGLPSYQSQKQIDEQELKEGFVVWRDHIAKPFGEARGYNFSTGDINRLRGTLPKELEGSPLVDKFFQSIKPTPLNGSPSGDDFNTSGVSRNIEDIDREISQFTQDLSALEGQKPEGYDYLGQKRWADNQTRIQRRLNQLNTERRRYQSKVDPARIPAPGAKGSGKRKLTDPAEARKYLERAGGDKNKARELARKEGWTF